MTSSCHVYLCLDGKPKGKLIDESYKANRDESRLLVYRNLPKLVYLLQNLQHVHIKYNPVLEADEVIFSLTRLLSGKKIIVSTDNDLLQSLQEDTEILRKDKVINESVYYTDMFEKFRGVSPDRLPIYRALVGDSSDNLKPPVPRFPKDLAARVAQNVVYNGDCPSPDTLIELFESFRDSITKSKWSMLANIIKEYEKFSTNFKIMKLSVHTELDYPYLKENPVIPNFPQSIMSIFRTIKALDNTDTRS